MRLRPAHLRTAVTQLGSTLALLAFALSSAGHAATNPAEMPLSGESGPRRLNLSPWPWLPGYSNGILPSTGALFGAVPNARSVSGANRQTNMEDFEAQVGRKMTLERVYYVWDDPWPNAYDYWSRDLGRTLIISWGAGFRNGTYVKWADIANGVYDATIDARASDIKAFGAPIIFAFNHEPLLNDPSGTPSDFIRAYQHIHDRFQVDGVTNVSYSLILMGYTYTSGDADQFYPGDTYVDIIGADGYNWYGCSQFPDALWTPFSDVFDSFYNYGISHRKPMVIAEWGSGEDDQVPARKAQWITDAETQLKLWPQIKAVAWYEALDNGVGCNSEVDTSLSSLGAFTALGADPYFNPTTAPPKSTNVGAYVESTDNSFTSPPAGYPTEGKAIKWIVGGPSKHSVTDSSGMGYFDSGSQAAGSTYSFTFVGAGAYPYKCTLHSGMTGTIKVPMIISPTSGKTTTTFKVTWASGLAPAGYVYDVQIQRPGNSTWSDWKSDVTTATANFTPDSGTGTYSFHARLQNNTSGKAAWYSDPFAISVSGSLQPGIGQSGGGAGVAVPRAAPASAPAGRWGNGGVRIER